ncbi:MAG: hypothetical protein FD143_2841 [Ignavibacteria bacterium]|nr:MAG: hypothetical protein FD143_2841 [Ignavibacteria bacterium]
MIEQLSKMKAWGKFLEWTYTNKYHFNNERELLSLLVEFCDSKNYFIEYSHTGTNWLTYIYKQETETTFNLDTKATRTEATKAAIIKCFELMEK